MDAILAICSPKSFAPPEAGWRSDWAGISNCSSCEAAIFPRATTFSPEKRSRKALSTGRPADCSARVGVRLLKIPARGSNGCHGNAFQRTNSSGRNPCLSSLLQTMVAVGSEKPSGYLSGLLVRRGLIFEKKSFGSIPASAFFPSRIRSEVMGIPLKCPPRYPSASPTTTSRALPTRRAKIGTQLRPANGRRLRPEIVLRLGLPPGIKDRAGRRVLQEPDELFDQVSGHSCNPARARSCALQAIPARHCACRVVDRAKAGGPWREAP